METALNPVDVPDELLSAVDAVRAVLRHRFAPGGRPLRFVRGQEGHRFSTELGDEVLITYGSVTAALRGLAAVLSGEEVAEQARFGSVMVMLDLSRNAVMRPSVLADYFLRVALMGATTVLLYTEDTYEIPGEPLFGAARGRLSLADLSALDAAAASYGLELIPCIQTLGHLENVLKWSHFAPVRDTERVLLADSDRTLELVARMIDALSSAVRSRRIHVGLDEVQGLGSGAFAGEGTPAEIYSRHVARVAGLCRARGLEPMMWSDIVMAWDGVEVPAGMTLVNWDYYATEPQWSRDRISAHRQLGSEPVQAMAAFTWIRCWTQIPASQATIRAGIEAATSERLDEVMITLWGNDGAQCDLWSALPVIQTYADLSWGSSRHAAHFETICDATWAAWIRASDIDILDPQGESADIAAGWYRQHNPGAWLLWSDPVLDLVDVAAVGATAQQYARTGADLRDARRPGDDRLELVALWAEALETKVALHLALRPTVATGDGSRAGDLLDLVSETAHRVTRLRDHHREQWCRDNRPWGWELLDRRYHGLLGRLDTLGWELRRWAADPAAGIELLTQPQISLYGTDGTSPKPLAHDMVASGSVTPRVGPR